MKNKKHTAAFFNLRAGIWFALVCAVASSAHANIITVTNTNDSGAGSLRQALVDANDGDTINFAAWPGTIGLTSGELLVDKSITISGPGAANLAVNGNAMSRVFHIASSRTVTISGLTITNGNASGIQRGGGIYNDHSTLTVNNCTINGNVAGGGIYNDGQFGGAATLQINNSIINANSNDGIDNYAAYGGYAAAQINSSSITANPGGAIWSVACLENSCGQATLQVDSSTLSGNSGGIFADPRTHLVVANSTLSGNGVDVTNLDNVSTSSISNSTLNETSTNAGCISNEAGFITIDNTVLKVGPSGHSIVNIGGGHVTSLGYNLSSDDGGGYLNGPGDQINTDPILGPLQDNGGPTFTHALLPGSPALNAGNPNFAPPPFFDQRGPGFDRVRNGRLDVGSYEEQALLNTPTPTSTPTATPTPTATATATFTPTPTATATSTRSPCPCQTPSPKPRPTAAPRPTSPPRLTPPPTPTGSPRPTPAPRP